MKSNLGHYSPVNATKKYQSLSSESRAVLVLLGFAGVRDFAAKCGINHATAADLMRTRQMRMLKRHSVVVRAHECLHSAYLDRRSSMTRPMRNFVRDWARRWKIFALESALWNETPGKHVTGSKENIRQRDQRQANIKLAVKQNLDALEWK